MNDVIDVVGISGGKDSTATALFAIENLETPPRFVFCDTGLEAPATYEYIEYLSEKLKELTGSPLEVLKADFTEKIARKREKLVARGEVERAKHMYPTGIPFLDICIHAGRFPTSLSRFCTGYCKQEVIKKYLVELSADANVFSWVGERAEESTARAKKEPRETIYKNKNGNEVYIYRPLLHWKEQQCFDMLERHGIKPNPLYAQGFGRVGCFPCIMFRKNELRMVAELYPEVVEKIKDWEQRVSLTAPSNSLSTFFHPVKCRGALGIEAAVEWSKTPFGQRRNKQ